MRTTGPLTWITKGTLDLDLHMLVPHRTQWQDLLDRILDEVDGLKDIAMDKLESVMPPMEPDSVKEQRMSLKKFRHYGLKHSFTNQSQDEDVSQDSLLKLSPKSDIMMLWKVKIKDLKANVPIVNPELSYMSNALIRPVVGYMNANRTLIPLSMSAQMDLVHFSDIGQFQRIMGYLLLWPCRYSLRRSRKSANGYDA
jgi:distribution and morphology protein 31